MLSIFKTVLFQNYLRMLLSRLEESCTCDTLSTGLMSSCWSLRFLCFVTCNDSGVFLVVCPGSWMKWLTGGVFMILDCTAL